MSDRPVTITDVLWDASKKRPDVEWQVESLRRACGWDGESDPPDFMVRGSDGALMRQCPEIDRDDFVCPLCGDEDGDNVGWLPVTDDGDTDECHGGPSCGPGECDCGPGAVR